MKLSSKFILTVFTLASICACSKNNLATGSEPVKNGNKIQNNETGVFYSLSDYLKRVPGLQFTNGYFRIRGPQSFSETEPLYVVNGVILGNSYSQANSTIDPNDIARVNVLKDVASTSKYGMRGAHGVIEITTKSK